MKTTEETVREIVVEQLAADPKQVTLAADFIADLGADSLDVIEMAMALEEKFNIEIPDREMEKLKTVGDVVNYFDDKKR